MANDRNVLFTSRTYKQHVDFWKKKLSEIDEAFLFRRTAPEDSRGDQATNRLELKLDDEARAIISGFANGQDKGILVVALSALVCLLARYSHRRMILVKSPLLKTSRLREAN